jgi:hypothetical protein
VTELAIDPRAAAAIDDRAKRLIVAVRQVPRRRPSGPSWQPDIPIAATLSETDIVGEIDAGTTSPDGHLLSLEFSHAGNMYTLDGEQYVELRTVVTQVLKASPIGSLASARSVERILRRWVKDAFRGNASQTASEYLLSSLNKTVSRFSVWIPLEELHVQGTISLGRCVLRPVTAEFLAQLGAKAPPELREQLTARFSRYRGHGALVVECDGEIAKARETALAAAERTLGAMSLLSPAAFRVAEASGVCLWGSHRRSSATTFEVAADGSTGSHEGATAPPPRPESFDENYTSELAPLLGSLHVLLLADDKNALAEKLLDALAVYRRAVISPEPAEKLIFVFVALEMLLVRDGNEPLQDNVATRMAFLIGTDVPDRRSIIKTVKDAYSLRSSFIHHGNATLDTTQADAFLLLAWRTLVNLVSAIHQFATKDALIAALEDRKLS